jgi:hypothetical protein
VAARRIRTAGVLPAITVVGFSILVGCDDLKGTVQSDAGAVDPGSVASHGDDAGVGSVFDGGGGGGGAGGASAGGGGGGDREDSGQGGAGGGGDASGDASACDSGCGTTSKTVFVTSAGVQPGVDFKSLGDADSACQNFANRVGLNGTFMAWLSDDTTSAASRLSQSGGPYVLVDGTLVARNWAGLVVGSLVHAIDETETGGPVAQGPGAVCPGPADVYPVWTGTDSSGKSLAGQTCSNWAGTYGSEGAVGLADVTDNTWSYSCYLDNNGAALGCSYSLPIYCFEQ